MSKERELLKECRLMLDNPINGTAGRNLQIRITELLAQPEHIENKFDRVKSNREFYQAGYAEAERKLKSEQTEQEPVAWITEWVQRYRHNDTPIMDSAVSFTKGDAPAVPNPNYIPLYTAPPKREPLTPQQISEGNQSMLNVTREAFKQGVIFAEKAHGIGGGE